MEPVTGISLRRNDAERGSNNFGGGYHNDTRFFYYSRRGDKEREEKFC